MQGSVTILARNLHCDLSGSLKHGSSKTQPGFVLIQIRDRRAGGWEFPFESGNISEVVTKPMLLLQYNWHKMQQYNQDDLVSLTHEVFGNQFHKIAFQYVPKQETSTAALNFHLTKFEKADIALALKEKTNALAFERYKALLRYR